MKGLKDGGREGGRRRGNADVGARAREAFEKVANV